MKTKKVSFAILLIFLFILLEVNFGFSQAKKEEIIVYGGIIKSISKDYKSILVYSQDVLISPNTRIFNEKGNPLRIDDLRLELYVVVEGVESPKGLLAKKITVKKPPEV